jgi:hypothetical protein
MYKITEKVYKSETIKKFLKETKDDKTMQNIDLEVGSLETLEVEELRDLAISLFHKTFGTGRLDWDARTYLHEIKEYYSRQDLIDFIYAEG